MAKTTNTKNKKETAIEKKDQEAAMMMFDYGDDAGAGYEAESANDIQIPIITILQALSPQCKKPEKGGIEGAEPGKLFNTVTSELKDEVRFIPAKSQKLYVEWVPRDEGGGFVAQHALDSELVLACKKSNERSPYKLDNGHELIETQYLYCVEVDDNDEPTGSFFVLSFVSTKLTSWRKWNTAVHTLRVPGKGGAKIQPPIFAHVVKLSTREQSNKHGDFYNFVLSPAHGDMKKSLVGPQSEGFSAAKDLRALIESGAARAAEKANSQDGGGDAGHGDGPDAF